MTRNLKKKDTISAENCATLELSIIFPALPRAKLNLLNNRFPVSAASTMERQRHHSLSLIQGCQQRQGLLVALFNSKGCRNFAKWSQKLRYQAKSFKVLHFHNSFILKTALGYSASWSGSRRTQFPLLSRTKPGGQCLGAWFWTVPLLGGAGSCWASDIV